MTAQNDAFDAEWGRLAPHGATASQQSYAILRKLVRDRLKGRFSFLGSCNTRPMSRPRATLARASALLSPLALAACATAPLQRSFSDAVEGQRAWATVCAANDEWDKPGPPFRIYGNTYYVGTCGITALLVTDRGGHTLIDSGTDKGAEIVLDNIRALGLAPPDVRTILMSHEHFDHVGGMARAQAATGATIITSPEAAAFLRSGTPDPADPQAASGHPPFPPVTGRIETLTSEAPRLLAGTSFRPIATPGHTPGALSWSWRACEGRECKTIVYVDSLNPISADGFRFSDHPDLVAGMRRGIAAIAAADCDIVIAPHPGAVQLRERLIGERALFDQEGCRAFAAIATTRLDTRLAKESAGG